MNFKLTDQDLALTNISATIQKIFGPKTTPHTCKSDHPNFSAPVVQLMKSTPTSNDSSILTILSGPANEFLCALAVKADDGKTLGEILNLHPDLATATRTHWRGYFFVWLRIPDWRPPSCKFAGMTFISDGLFPVTYHDSRKVVNFVQDLGRGIPVVKFDELARNPRQGVGDFFRIRKLQREHGNLVFTDNHGKPQINPNFFAHYIVELTGIQFDTFRAEFTSVSESSKAVVCPEDVKRIIIGALRAFSEVGVGMVPSALIKPRAVDAVFSTLKTISARKTIGACAGLIRFTQERLVCRPDSSLTTEEVYEIYRAYCGTEDVVAMPRRDFQKQISVVLRQVHSVAKSHCVPRSDASGKRTARNGFFGIALKDVSTGHEDVQDA